MLPKKKSVYKFYIFLFILFCHLIFTQLSIYAEDSSIYTEIDEAKLSATQLPTNWILDKEIIADENALNKFKQIYNIRPKEIFNQVFTVNDKKIQINYCLFDTESAAKIGALKLASFVNNLNIVFEKKNTVIEIISVDNWLKQEALKLLKSSSMNNVILGQNRVPENWILWNVMLVPSSKLSFFENKLGARIENIINQIFKIEDNYLRINYISGINESETRELYVHMKEKVSNKNIIIKKGSVVIEIISDKDSLKNKALRFFNF